MATEQGLSMPKPLQDLVDEAEELVEDSWSLMEDALKNLEEAQGTLAKDQLMEAFPAVRLPNRRGPRDEEHRTSH